MLLTLTKTLSPARRRVAVALTVFPAAFVVFLAVRAALGLTDQLETPARLGYAFTVWSIAALCFVRGSFVRRERRAWQVLGLGVVIWSLGDLYWIVFIEGRGEPPFPSWADAFYLAFYPAAYTGLMLLARARFRRFHASIWFDGLTAALATAALGAAIFGRVDAISVNLVYPAGDLLLLMIVVAMLALSGWRPGRAWGILAAALVILAVRDTLYVWQAAGGDYENDDAFTVLWPLGLLLLGIAAWQRPRIVRDVVLEGWRVLGPPIVSSLIALGVLIYGATGDVTPVAIVLAALTILAAIVRVTLTFRDVVELAATAGQAAVDPLTGLPSRHALDRRLGVMVDAVRRSGSAFALLMIDLNRYRELTDTLGRRAGELVLTQVGPRLEPLFRPDDTLARLGDDEFVLLMTCDRAGTEAEEVAARIGAAFDQPFAVEGLELRIDATIGIALCPDHAEQAAELVQRAEVAVVDARKERTPFALYEPETDRFSRERLQLSTELHRALDQDQLELHFQPKAELAGGRVVGVEALVRWRHPERGLLGPYEFLPLAEHVGLMPRLTLTVLRDALRQCSRWRDEGIELPVAVNLSVTNLIDRGLATNVKSLLDEWSIPPRMLQLEVTEDIVMVDPDRAVEVLEDVAALGVGVSLDDYGTGYSSLAYLKRLAVSEIKIDRSFVSGMAQDADDLTIVSSTVDMAHSLRLRVVAEGVEDQVTWDLLKSMGCDQVQGFLLAKPLPPEALLDWLLVRAQRLAPVRA